MSRVVLSVVLLQELTPTQNMHRTHILQVHNGKHYKRNERFDFIFCSHLVTRSWSCQHRLYTCHKDPKIALAVTTRVRAAEAWMEPFFPYCKRISTLINMLSAVERNIGLGFLNSCITVLQEKLFTLYFWINIRLVYFKQRFERQEPVFLCRNQTNFKLFKDMNPLWLYSFPAVC